ncbi:MAG: hypothetical protein IKJ17_04090 [Clostridia bacterium]|nr:hypothetical protein [Clostridia bacterium]
MKLKRIVAILLAFCMVFSTMTFNVFADDSNVIAVATADAFCSAFTNVKDGETVLLDSDIVMDSKISVPDGVTIDLNGKTLYVNVENSTFGNVTVTNGNIVLGKDDVQVCDGYFMVNAGKTLVVNDVKVSSADGGIKGYCVFHLGMGANLDLIGSELDIRDNEYSAGYIVYANESTATVDVTDTTVYGKNVNGIVHATTVIDNSSFTVEDAVEHGINRSAVTIDDSTVTISGGTGRGITAQHGDLVISGNSVVKISEMGEATIELRDNKNLSVADTATVKVDVAVNNTTAGTVTGNVTVGDVNAVTVAKVNGVEYSDIQEAIVAAAPAGTVELVDDVVVDEWVMISETLHIGSGQIITISIDGLTIDGKGHSLTVNAIESATNGNRLFYDATNLNVKDLTINYAEGVTGGIGLTSGTISGVTFNGGVGILPGVGDITITGCTFNTTGSAIYNETERDNLVVTGNHFNTAAGQYAIYLRGNTTFKDNTVVSGKVNVTNSATGEISGNDFGTERFKVYNGATATIENNTINNLVFNDASKVNSLFKDNVLSADAETAMANAGAVNMTSLKGTGTETDPYVIDSVASLLYFDTEAKAGNTYQDKYVVLGADINFAWGEWFPVNFYGTFDGKGHTISNLTYVPNASGKMGFFQTIKGPVSNLTLDGVKGTVPASGQFGGFTRYLNSNVTNVHVKNITIDVDKNADWLIGGFTGYVNSGACTDCSVENFVVNAPDTASGPCIGGFIGSVRTNTTFTNCDVKGFKVNANSTGDLGVGGFVPHTQTGWNNVKFVDCDVTGINFIVAGRAEVAGFVTWPGSHTSATNCHTEGMIDVTGVTTGGYAGGFYGNLGWNHDLGQMGHFLTDCSADVEIYTKNVDAGGFIGSATVAGTPSASKYLVCTNCSASGNVTAIAGGNADTGAFAGSASRGVYNNCTASGTVKNNGAGYAGQFIGNIVDVTPTYDYRYPAGTREYAPDVTAAIDCMYTGASSSLEFIGNADENATYCDTAEEFEAEKFAYIVASGYVATVGSAKYKSIQAAIDAAQDGDTVVLINDIDIAKEKINTLGGKYNTLYKVEGKSVTVDMNGKTISGTYNGSSMLVGVFSTENGGHLTLTGNGTVDVTAGTTVYGLLVNYDATSTLTVENGTYKADKVSDSIIYSGKGTTPGLYDSTQSGVTINGGTFTLGNIDNENAPWIFNVGGAGDSYAVVNGGTFNFNITRQKWINEVVVPETHYIQDNGDGTWTVKEGAVAYTTETVLTGPYPVVMNFGYATLAEAFAAADQDEKVTLLADITLAESVASTKANVTLDLNGKTITGDKSVLSVEGGDLIIVDSSAEQTGAVVATGNFAIDILDAKVTLKAGNVKAASYTVYLNNATSEFVMEGGKVEGDYAVAAGAGNAYIKGGTVYATNYYPIYAWEGASIAISGGTFSFRPNSVYIADGYGAEETTVDGATWYKVVEIQPVAYIGTTGYYSIAKAIEAAVPGDTIVVNSLEQRGDVVVNKAVTLVAADGADVVINGQLAIKADGVTVKGFTVDCGGTALQINAKDVVIEACDITGPQVMYQSYTSGKVTFKDSKFTATSSYAIHFDGSAGGEVVIDNCEVTGWVSFAASIGKVTMTGSDFNKGNYAGMRLYQGADIADCTFDEGYLIDIAADKAVVNVDNTTVANGSVKDMFDSADFEANDVVIDGNLMGAVAYVGTTGYRTLDEAMTAAQAGDTVTIMEGTYAVPAMKAGITVVGEGEVLLEGTLSNTLENLTLKNLHIKGGNAQRWAYAKGDLVFENVTFEATSVYALHFDGISEGTNLLYKDCTIIGWAAMSGSPASAVFDGCTFKDNGAYGVIRTYFDAEIKNCTFDVDGANPDDVYQDGIHAVGATVEVTNSTNSNGDIKDLLNISGKSEIYVDGTLVLYPVATVGEDYYSSLAAAFDGAEDGDTVTLIADVETTESVTVDGKSIVLELNGKTVTGTDNTTKNYGLINVNTGAQLTVNDTVGTGKITLVATNDRDWGSYSSVISNQRGKLIVNGGTIEHLGGTDMAYGIDNLTNGKGTYAETVINGGTVKSTYRAIRQFLNGTEADNILTVNGGTIEGANKSIWMQDPNKNANTGSLTVGENASLNGNVYLTVTAESTEWPVEVAISAAALKGESTVLTSNVPKGYILKVTDGVYGVVEFHPVAVVNGVEFETLEEARVAAANGETIEIVGDAVLDEQLDFGYYNYKYSIGKDASLTANTGRAVISYGNVVDVEGDIADAKTADKTTTKKSMYVPNGLSFNGDGYGVELNVNNAYVSYGSSTSKNSTATGEFNFNFTNSIAEFTNNFVTTLTKAGYSLTPTFNINVKDGVLTTASHMELWHAGTNMTVDNSNVTIGGSFANGGTLTLTNGAVMKVNNPIMSSHGGNTGTINIDGATLDLTGGNEAWVSEGAINLTADAKLILDMFSSTGTITIDASDFTGNTVTVIDGTAKSGLTAASITLINGKGVELVVEDGDVILKDVPIEAVATADGVEYETLAEAVAAGGEVVLLKDVVLDETIVVAAEKEVVLDLNGKTIDVGYNAGSTTNHLYAFENYGKLTIKDGVGTGAINARGNYNYGEMIIDGGTINAIDGNGGMAVYVKAGKATFNDGKIATTYEDDNLVANGGFDATTVQVEAGATFEMNGGVIETVCDFTPAVNNHGTTTINNGEVKSVHTTVINYGDLTVAGGTLTNNGIEGITSHVIWAADGTTTITDGTLNGKDNYNGFNVDTAADAVVNVSGGTFLKAHSGSFYGEGTITVTGGTYFDNIDEAYVADGYKAIADFNDMYVVGVAPTATVNNLGAVTVSAGDYTVFGGGDNTVDMPLSFVMQFIADQSAAEGAASPYADWYADFVITVSGLENGTFDASGCYLAGHYGSFGWWKIPLDGMTVEDAVRYPVMLSVAGAAQQYEYICSGVADFKCAMYLTPEVLAENPNLEVNLELCVIDSSKGSDEAKLAVVEDRVYKASEYTYTANDFMLKADYSAVEEALANVPADLTIYTDTSSAVVQAAIDAVIYGLGKDEQATVDAYAAAINQAVENLVLKVAVELSEDLIDWTLRGSHVVADGKLIFTAYAAGHDTPSIKGRFGGLPEGATVALAGTSDYVTLDGNMVTVINPGLGKLEVPMVITSADGLTTEFMLVGDFGNAVRYTTDAWVYQYGNDIRTISSNRTIYLLFDITDLEGGGYVEVTDVSRNLLGRYTVLNDAAVRFYDPVYDIGTVTVTVKDAAGEVVNVYNVEVIFTDDQIEGNDNWEYEVYSPVFSTERATYTVEGDNIIITANAGVSNVYVSFGKYYAESVSASVNNAMVKKMAARSWRIMASTEPVEFDVFFDASEYGGEVVTRHVTVNF